MMIDITVIATMTVFELARLFIVFVILVLNSYTDIKYRTVWGRDRHYLVISLTGIAILLVSMMITYENNDNLTHNTNVKLTNEIFSMSASITLALILYRCKAVASGDTIIILAMSVILPSVFDVYFLPCLVALGAIFVLGVAIVSYNVILNVSWIVSSRTHSPPASAQLQPYGSKNTLTCVIRHVALFFMAHKRRVWERHVISIEDGKGDFSLFKHPFESHTNEQRWDSVSSDKYGELVMVAAPVVPFLLLVLTCILLVRVTVFTL